MPEGTRNDLSDADALFDDLLRRAMGPRRISLSCVLLKAPETCAEPPLLAEILGLDPSQLPEVATTTLSFLEQRGLGRPDWHDFKWKLLAFDTLQDIFDSSIFGSGVTDSIFRVWYFYYEAKRLLSEALLCGLSGFYLASSALLRPFLEFALLQNYFRRLVMRASSYEAFDRYMSTHVVPSWNTIVKAAVPDDQFCKPIKAMVQMNLGGLSDSASHAHHPSHSPREAGADTPGPTLEGMFFWTQTRLVLQTVLWVYAVNFPMLFIPVDVERKFGFSPPVGYFIDKAGGEVLRRAFGDSDHGLLKDYATGQPEVRDLMDFYGSRSDLSDEEILATWASEDGPVPVTVPEGRSLVLVRMRALREAMAWRPSTQGMGFHGDTHAFESLTAWRQHYPGIVSRGGR